MSQKRIFEIVAPVWSVGVLIREDWCSLEPDSGYKGEHLHKVAKRIELLLCRYLISPPEEKPFICDTNSIDTSKGECYKLKAIKR